MADIGNSVGILRDATVTNAKFCENEQHFRKMIRPDKDSHNYYHYLTNLST